MNDMMTICRTTYTRVLRMRSLYFLLAVVLVLVGIAHLYTDLTCGRQKELMYDTGAALLSLVGLLTALMVTFDIARDLREKVAIVLFSKPLGRTHYLVGKFCGVAWLATVNLLILTLGMLVILYAEKGVWQWDFFQVALATWGATMMLTAVGVLFASFLTELPAALLTVFVYVFGNSTEILYQSKASLARLFFSVLPNFGLMDFKAEIGNEMAISWTLIVAAVVYALVYSVALLSLSSILFHKRDLA